MNIFEAMFTCRTSQSDTVYGFKSLWETLTDSNERKLYIQRETKKKTFEYHRDRSCFLMLEPMMASVYIIAYQPGTHSVYSQSSTIQLVLWHVLTEIHMNKIHQVHLAVVESIILLQTLDALTRAETEAARTTTGLRETFTWSGINLFKPWSNLHVHKETAFFHKTIMCFI